MAVAVGHPRGEVEAVGQSRLGGDRGWRAPSRKRPTEAGGLSERGIRPPGDEAEQPVGGGGISEVVVLIGGVAVPDVEERFDRPERKEIVEVDEPAELVEVERIGGSQERGELLQAGPVTGLVGPLHLEPVE